MRRKITVSLFATIATVLVFASAPNKPISSLDDDSAGLLPVGFSSTSRTRLQSGAAGGHEFAPFWEIGAGYTSTVYLRNRDPKDTALAALVVLSHDGTALGRKELEIAPYNAVRLSVADLIRSVAPRGTLWGTAVVEFPDMNTKLMGDVIIENKASGVIFDVWFNGGYRYDTRNALYCPWWLPDQGADGNVVLFNATTAYMTVSPSLVLDGVERPVGLVNLGPHETKEMDLREMLRSAGAEDTTTGSVVLRYNGRPHALFPAMLLANSQTGFSLQPKFNALMDGQSKVPSSWWIPSIFLSPDPNLGFQAHDRLVTYALLSNSSNTEISPKFTASWGGAPGEPAGKADLSIAALAPLETRLINLSRLASGLVPAGVSHFSLQAVSPGPPGTVGLSIFSVGQNKNFVLQSGGSNGASNIIDSSYWDVSGELQDVLAVQNTGTVDVDVTASLSFPIPGGQWGNYILPNIHIPVGGNRILNLKKVILSGTPDRSGDIVPKGVTWGSLTLQSSWAGKGMIFGGSESFDPVRGGYGNLSNPPCDECSTCETCQYDPFCPADSYCVACCDNFDCCPAAPPPPMPSVSFSSIPPVIAGQTATTTATVTPSGNTTPIFLSATSNAAVVSPGNFTTTTTVTVKGLAAGAATLEALVTNPDSSSGEATVGSTSFTVYTPVPTSLQIVSGTNVQSSGPCTTNGQAGCGSGRKFTYQVLDQFGSPLKQAGLQVWDSFGTPLPNPLGITGAPTTTCSPPNTGPCNVMTNSSGQFLELGVGACSTVCYNSSTKMCITGGPSVNTQTWHVGSATIAQTISYYCDHVLVNGQ